MKILIEALVEFAADEAEFAELRLHIEEPYHVGKNARANLNERFCPCWNQAVDSASIKVRNPLDGMFEYSAFVT